jgi:hypothetical protein
VVFIAVLLDEQIIATFDLNATDLT